MSPDARKEARTGSALTHGTPVCLQLAGTPVLGTLHRPVQPAERGILLCAPFGWEEMCTHRGLRDWAAALAEAGHLALRFDLPGTGDSGGGPEDPNLVGTWVAAVVEAAAWLAGRAGTREIAVVGIGLGGLLALAATAAGAPIGETILWGVPASGRRLVREMKALSRIASEAVPSATLDGNLGGVSAPGAAGRAEGSDSVETMGYLLSPETVRALSALRVDRLSLPAGGLRRALLLRREGIDIDPALRETISTAGAAVDVDEGDDWGAFVAHPQQARAPRATIARSIRWLTAAPAPRRAGAAADAREEPTLAVHGDGIAVTEAPLDVDWNGQRLSGVLCIPKEAPARDLCVVLLGAGAVRRTGPNRVWVEAARRWAARGVSSYRVDLLGIGDADGADQTLLSDPELNAPVRLDQTFRVLDALAAHGLPRRFVLGGLCSGAYLSLRAALRDERVVGTLLVNLYAFDWTEALVRERETGYAVDALRRRPWRRVLEGAVTREQVLSVLRGLRPGRLRDAAGHPVEMAQRGLVWESLDALRDRHVHTLLLLGEGEALHEQLERLGVLDAIDRWPNIVLERIPSRDHMFRAFPLQHLVHARLDGALNRILELTP